MTDKEKIRAAVERQMQHHVCGYKNALKDILKFIDSLPEEPASKDLEEEIKETLNRKYGCKVTEGSDIWFTRQYQEDFERLSHIANWQKERMMKDAIDCKIEQEYYNPNIEIYLIAYIHDREDLKRGDKVKVIIIKEVGK